MNILGELILSKDGVLYFNAQKQHVEIVTMVDEQEMEASNRTGGFSLITPELSLVELMESFNLSEDCTREYLKSQLIQPTLSIKEQIKNKNKEISMPQGQTDIPEDFLYKHIISVLEKKNQEKYKGFWLLISYTPHYIMSYFGKEKVKNFVLQKIQLQKKESGFFNKRYF